MKSKLGIYKKYLVALAMLFASCHKQPKKNTNIHFIEMENLSQKYQLSLFTIEKEFTYQISEIKSNINKFEKVEYELQAQITKIDSSILVIWAAMEKLKGQQKKSSELKIKALKELEKNKEDERLKVSKIHNDWKEASLFSARTKVKLRISASEFNKSFIKLNGAMYIEEVQNIYGKPNSDTEIIERQTDERSYSYGLDSRFYTRPNEYRKYRILTYQTGLYPQLKVYINSSTQKVIRIDIFGQHGYNFVKSKIGNEDNKIEIMGMQRSQVIKDVLNINDSYFRIADSLHIYSMGCSSEYFKYCFQFKATNKNNYLVSEISISF